MKKSTVLSLATAGAIVATSIGTFAVWDSLGATSTGSITVAATPVKVTTGALGAEGWTKTENAENIEYTKDVEFDIANKDALTNLTLAPSLTNGETPVETSQATIGLTQTADTSFTGTVDSSLEDKNIYTVKVTVLDESLIGQTLDVAVTGTGTAR